MHSAGRHTEEMRCGVQNAVRCGECVPALLQVGLACTLYVCICVHMRARVHRGLGCMRARVM